MVLGFAAGSRSSPLRTYDPKPPTSRRARQTLPLSCTAFTISSAPGNWEMHRRGVSESGRYQPHSADDVLGNQYGDCKDKHTLFASLLQATGVTAYPALISSSRKLDADVPSPAQFDHVISVVLKDRAFCGLTRPRKSDPSDIFCPSFAINKRW